VFGVNRPVDEKRKEIAFAGRQWRKRIMGHKRLRNFAQRPILAFNKTVGLSHASFRYALIPVDFYRILMKNKMTPSNGMLQ
jgi:hypothetical protein